MKGPENRLITSVHKLLPASLHFEKMFNPYRGGTADVWYSGITMDLWVEWKWLSSAPKKKKVVPALSALQIVWLKSRVAEGRSVKVFVGCPSGVVRFNTPEEWEGGITAQQFRKRLSSRLEAADWITKYTMGPLHEAIGGKKTK